MVSPRVWKAHELEAMEPDERHQLSESAIVSDLSSVPEAFLDRVRARFSMRPDFEQESPAQT